MDSALLFIALLVVLIIVAVALYRLRRRRPKAVGPVVIQEGRLPGEPSESIVCPSCGKRFGLYVMFEGEIVKCPYCGGEVV